MVTIISKMQVPDYSRWAEQFKAGTESRKAFAVDVLSYGRDTSDPNLAIVIARVESEEKGRAMMKNPVLQKNLEDEGIRQIEVLFIEE
jgi:hypothetical protein